MSVTRRDFVKGGVAGGAVVASGMVVIGCGNDVQPAPIAKVSVATDAAHVAAYDGLALLNDVPNDPSRGTIQLRPGRYKDLMKVGGAVTLEIPTLAPDPTRQFPATKGVLLVLRGPMDDDEADYIAMDSACTHQGCPLGYSAKDQLIECPCHGSRYRPVRSDTACLADPVQRPAVQGPRTYATSEAGNDVSVHLGERPTKGCPMKEPVPKVTNGTMVIALADYPELMTVGGTVVFQTVDGFAEPIAIYRKDANTFLAVNAQCTHQCCIVQIDATGSQWICPCHCSLYAFDGTVTRGPAKFALPQFPATFDGTKLTVTMIAIETQTSCTVDDSSTSC
jgi:Rieske Fe-S protein